MCVVALERERKAPWGLLDSYTYENREKANRFLHNLRLSNVMFCTDFMLKNIIEEVHFAK